MTATTTSITDRLRFLVRVEVVFTCIIRVIVPRIKILDYTRVGEVLGPPTPLTDLQKWPAFFTHEPLTSSTSKAMTTIHSHVGNTDIKEIVSQPLEELGRRLNMKKGIWSNIAKIDKEIETLQLVYHEVRAPDLPIRGF
jgi:hypothetical protein